MTTLEAARKEVKSLRKALKEAKKAGDSKVTKTARKALKAAKGRVEALKKAGAGTAAAVSAVATGKRTRTRSMSVEIEKGQAETADPRAEVKRLRKALKAAKKGGDKKATKTFPTPSKVYFQIIPQTC